MPAPNAPPLDINVLLNWAEVSYPGLFPGHQLTRVQPPYEYRYYPQTGNYVGAALEDVYVFGPVSNHQLQRVGSREDFRCRAQPQSCVSDYARSGWSFELSRLAHGVSGRATIVDERTVRITGFSYDGNGPQVYAYLGRDNSDGAFASGQAIGPIFQRRAYVNETIELRLPEGQTLDGYGALSIWCVAFRQNFGSGIFAPPAAR